MSITDTIDTSTGCITDEDPVEDATEDEDDEAEVLSSPGVWQVSAPIRVIPATDAQPLVTIRGLL